MPINVVYTCPLGSKCEEIINNEIHRCRWYVELDGLDASGNDQARWDCAIAWQPILQTETSGTNRGQTAAIESMREEQVLGHNEFMSVVLNAGKRKSIENE